MQVSERLPDSPFVLIGGESRVRLLVDRFYDLMELEPRFADLRALHPASLQSARDKLFWFLCGWLGGPQHYTDRFGHPMLRARHLPFAISTVERDLWLGCMYQAMEDEQVPVAVRTHLEQAFLSTADWMRNRPDA